MELGEQRPLRRSVPVCCLPENKRPAAVLALAAKHSLHLAAKHCVALTAEHHIESSRLGVDSQRLGHQAIKLQGQVGRRWQNGISLKTW